MGVSKTGGIPRNCRFTESGNDEIHGTFRTKPHTVVGYWDTSPTSWYLGLSTHWGRLTFTFWDIHGSLSGKMMIKHQKHWGVLSRDRHILVSVSPQETGCGCCRHLSRIGQGPLWLGRQFITHESIFQLAACQHHQVYKDQQIHDRSDMFTTNRESFAIHYRGVTFRWTLDCLGTRKNRHGTTWWKKEIREQLCSTRAPE